MTEKKPGSRRRNQKWSWDPDLANRVLLDLANGESLKASCERITEELAEGKLEIQGRRRLTTQEVKWWAVKDFDEFAAEVEEARRQGQWERVDACYETGKSLMDDALENSADPKLVGARATQYREFKDQVHWTAARVAPRDFNLKNQTEISGGLDLPFELNDELERRIKGLAAASRAKSSEAQGGDSKAVRH